MSGTRLLHKDRGRRRDFISSRRRPPSSSSRRRDHECASRNPIFSAAGLYDATLRPNSKSKIVKRPYALLLLPALRLLRGFLRGGLRFRLTLLRHCCPPGCDERWRHQVRAIANRQHCTAITTAQRKKQRLRLTKRIWRRALKASRRHRTNGFSSAGILIARARGTQRAWLFQIAETSMAQGFLARHDRSLSQHFSPRTRSADGNHACQSRRNDTCAAA